MKNQRKYPMPNRATLFNMFLAYNGANRGVRSNLTSSVFGGVAHFGELIHGRSSLTQLLSTDNILLDNQNIICDHNMVNGVYVIRHPEYPVSGFLDHTTSEERYAFTLKFGDSKRAIEKFDDLVLNCIKRFVWCIGVISKHGPDISMALGVQNYITDALMQWGKTRIGDQMDFGPMCCIYCPSDFPREVYVCFSKPYYDYNQYIILFLALIMSELIEEYGVSVYCDKWDNESKSLFLPYPVFFNNSAINYKGILWDYYIYCLQKLSNCCNEKYLGITENLMGYLKNLQQGSYIGHDFLVGIENRLLHLKSISNPFDLYCCIHPLLSYIELIKLNTPNLGDNWELL